MLEGETIHQKYYLKKLLGSGSFAGVFLADEVLSDRFLRQVAIKLIPPSAKEPDRHFLEFKVASNLSHPYLLQGLTTGFWEHTQDLKFFYLVTEVAEYNLESYLEKNTLSLPEIKEITSHLAQALDYLHSQTPSWVHRDVKPANILKIKKNWQLGDYGIISPVNSQVTYTSPMGTRVYAPPEFYQGNISCLWDVWSLGVIIYEMLTKKLPFSGDTFKQLEQQILNQEPTGIAQLPHPFGAIVTGCLQKQVSHRWCAKDILNALDNRPVKSSTNKKINYVGFYDPTKYVDVFEPFTR